MDASEIDRDLQQALAVEPSPEFVARVRAQIASEPAASVWWRPRVLVAAGALAVVIVAAVLVLRPHEQVPSKAADGSSPAEHPAVVPERTPESLVAQGFSPGATPVVVQGFSPAAPGPAVSRPAVSSSKRDDPEVLVSQAEMKGLRLLITLANQGDARLESLLAEPVDATPITAIEPIEIVIAPITIEPLASDTY